MGHGRLLCCAEHLLQASGKRGAVRGIDEMQAKKWDVLWSKGVKETETGPCVLCVPQPRDELQLQSHFPFLSPISLGAEVLSCFPCLPGEAIYGIPLWLQNQKLKSCYGASCGDIHPPEHSTEHFSQFHTLPLAVSPCLCS